MDDVLVRQLNAFFNTNSVLEAADRILVVAPLLAIVCIVGLAWLREWGRSSYRRTTLVIGASGAGGALAVNWIVGHVVIRPRPFVALPIQAIVSHAADSSFFSDHLGVAGALTTSLLIARFRLGVLAAVLSLLLALGRVGAGVHYPSDVVVGAAPPPLTSGPGGASMVAWQTRAGGPMPGTSMTGGS